MEPDERSQALRSPQAAPGSSRSGSGEAQRETNRPVRRRSEATSPSTFDPAIYTSRTLEPPESFEADVYDSNGRHEPFANGSWQKTRPSRDGYRLRGGLMMSEAAPSRWAVALADRQVMQRSAVNVLLIGLWYLFSTSISVYNKWMFSPDHLDFHFPLFTTSLHMLVQFSLASAIIYFFPRFRPRHDSLTTSYNERRRQASAGNDKPLMTMYFYLTRIAPCGTATGLDIGLGNMSLKFISLTFLTMCKSSALAFVLLFAFLFRLETPSWKLVLIIATMVVGVSLMVAGEARFDLLGFILIILSSFFSGFRWALTQILLLRNPATANPFSSIFFLAPIMMLSLLILAFPIEGPSALGTGLQKLAANEGAGRGFGLLIFPGVLAFCMTSAEFALLRRTSVVTLSICGIFKEVIVLLASQVTYHDKLTPINLGGMAVTMGAIVAYNYIKINRMRQEARAEVIGVDEEVDGARGARGDRVARGEGEERTGLLGPDESDDDARKEGDVMASGTRGDAGERRARISPTSRSHLGESPDPL